MFCYRWALDHQILARPSVTNQRRKLMFTVAVGFICSGMTHLPTIFMLYFLLVLYIVDNENLLCYDAVSKIVMYTF